MFWYYLMYSAYVFSALVSSLSYCLQLPITIYESVIDLVEKEVSQLLVDTLSEVMINAAVDSTASHVGAVGGC